MSILVLDIDDFKERNDLYGHAIGDQALRVLGGILKSCIRTGDIAARIGGEEFGLLLPGCDAQNAVAMAQRLQEQLAIADHGPVPLTISIGASSIDATATGGERLVSRADDAMYEAKRTGKNKTLHHNALLADLLRTLRHQDSDGTA